MEITNINFYDTILWRAKCDVQANLQSLRNSIENEKNSEILDILNAKYENEIELLCKIDKEIDRIEIGDEEIW